MRGRGRRRHHQQQRRLVFPMMLGIGLSGACSDSMPKGVEVEEDAEPGPAEVDSEAPIEDYVIASNGEFIHYVDDAPVGSPSTFAATAPAVSFTGDAVYTVTHGRNTAFPVLPDHAVWKCDASGEDCEALARFYSKPRGVAFQPGGDGFVLFEDGLIRFANGALDVLPGMGGEGLAIAYTGTSVYTAEIRREPHNELDLNVCDRDGEHCQRWAPPLDFGSNPASVSVDRDRDGVGVVLTSAGRLVGFPETSWENLPMEFRDFGRGVSLTHDAVYVLTRTGLERCDVVVGAESHVRRVGDCTSIANYPAPGAFGVSFYEP